MAAAFGTRARALSPPRRSPTTLPGPGRRRHRLAARLSQPPGKIPWTFRGAVSRRDAGPKDPGSRDLSPLPMHAARANV